MMGSVLEREKKLEQEALRKMTKAHEERMKLPLCPFLLNNPHAEDRRCRREKCAWFVHGSCAISIIAMRLDSLITGVPVKILEEEEEDELFRESAFQGG